MSQEKEKKLREGNVRGIFGYPKQFHELSKRYRINIKKVNYILSKYRTMENFINVYRLGKLDEEDYTILRDNIRRCIDIKLNDNIGYDRLMSDIIEKDVTSGKYDIEGLKRSRFIIYDSDMLRNIINNEIRKRYSDIIKDKYGLENGIYRDDIDIARDIGVTKSRIEIIKRNIFFQLKIKLEKICIYSQNNKDGEQEILEEILEKAFFSSDYIFCPDSEYESENSNKKHEEVLSDFIKDFDEKEEKQKNELQIYKMKSIGSFNISIRTFNTLYAANIHTVEDLENAYWDIINNKIAGLGKKGKTEVIAILKRNKIGTSIENLNFSNRTCNALYAAQIYTIEDLKNAYSDIINNKIPNLGSLSIKEVTVALVNKNLTSAQTVEQLNHSTANKNFIGDETIEQLNLSKRSYNALNDVGIKTIEDLKQIYLEDRLRMILKLGRKSQEEIIRVLKERNIIQDGEQDEEKTELGRLKEQKDEIESERKALQQTAEKAREFLDSYDIEEDIDTEGHE